MTWRGSCGGRPVVIDDVYERDEVARDAQLEAFFQWTEEWFNVLSKQLTALAVGNQPQNCHPNPCNVEDEQEEEEDLDIEEEDCNIEEHDEYIDKVYAVDWDSPPIYDNYPDENKVIYI